MGWNGKKKLKLCDATGVKIDSVVITSEKDAENVISRWKKKGLF